MYFKDVIGQEEVKLRLTGATERGFIPHAQLFTEAGGAGAFPLALAYARYLNCANPSNKDACGKCASCAKYDELAHPDLHFVFPIISRKEKKKETCSDYAADWRKFLREKPYFSIEDWLACMDAGNSQALIYSRESDEIMKKLSLRTYEAKYRILFIWLPEKMHETCANKILKLVEEPTQDTLIFMVSEDPEMILGTIQSRVQRINVRRINSMDMEAALVDREGVTLDAARELTHLAAGNYLKAKELINTSEENEFFLEQFKAMMRNAWTRDMRAIKTAADLMAGIGRERQKEYLSYCQRLVRENFVCCFKSPDVNYMSGKEAEFALKFSPFVNENNIEAITGALSEAEMHVTHNVNSKMIFFDLALQLAVQIKSGMKK